MAIFCVLLVGNVKKLNIERDIFENMTRKHAPDAFLMMANGAAIQNGEAKNR